MWGAIKDSWNEEKYYWKCQEDLQTYLIHLYAITHSSLETTSYVSLHSQDLENVIVHIKCTIYTYLVKLLNRIRLTVNALVIHNLVVRPTIVEFYYRDTLVGYQSWQY